MIQPRLRCPSPSALGLALAAGGCFHDVPPQFDCGGAFETCMTSTSTTGATDPTTSGTSSSATSSSTGAPVDNSRHFRLDSLAIIDPHLFLGSPCTDVTDVLNAMILAAQIDSGEFNLLLSFEDYDLDALEPALSEAVSCDLAAMTCVVAPTLSLSVPAERIDAGDCVTLDFAALSSKSPALLNTPVPICFRTMRAELSLPIQGAKIPLELIDAQIVFNLAPLDDATTMTNGLLYGFFTRKSAEGTMVTVQPFMSDVWSMITGASDMDCAAKNPDYLPSAETYMGTEGVWMAVNFSATRVSVTEGP